MKTEASVENGFISLGSATRKTKVQMLISQLSSFVTSDELLWFSKIPLPYVQRNRLTGPSSFIDSKDSSEIINIKLLAQCQVHSKHPMNVAIILFINWCG